MSATMRNSAKQVGKRCVCAALILVLSLWGMSVTALEAVAEPDADAESAEEVATDAGADGAADADADDSAVAAVQSAMDGATVLEDGAEGDGTDDGAEDGADGDSAEKKKVGTDDIIDGIFYDSNGLASGVYHYRDNYFNQRAFAYNPSLASMSIIMAMAAYGPDGTDDETYSRHSANLERMVKELGFKDFLPNPDYNKAPTRNSIGVGIAHKTIKDENGDDASLVVIAIRGANYQTEWAGNTLLGEIGEASGFVAARNQVVEHLANYINVYGDDLHEHTKFWIVGFSRASATANLTGNLLNSVFSNLDGGSWWHVREDGDLHLESLAKQMRTNNAYSDLRDAMMNNGLKPRQSDLYCYGFEVPAGGEDGSRSGYSFHPGTKNIWNLVYHGDLVTKVAPSVWGFQRYGTDIVLDEDLSGNKISDKRMCEEYEQVKPGATADWMNRELSKNSFHSYKFDSIGDIKKGKVTADSIDKLETKNLSDFLDEMLNIAANSVGGRENYVNGLQVWAAPLADACMNGNSKKVMSVAKDAFMDEIGNSGLIELLYSAMEFHNSEPYMASWRDAQRIVKGLVTDGLNAAITAWENDPEISAYFEPGELDRMRLTIPSVATLATDVLSSDVSESYDLYRIATTIGYAGELFDVHSGKVVLSYLRVNDPNYGSPEDPTVVDSNFMQHIVEVKPCRADRVLDEGITIKVYRDSSKPSTLLATVTPDGVEYASDDARSQVYVGYHEDNSIEIRCTSQEYARGYADFVITGAKESELRLGYHLRNGNDPYHEDIEQWWENMLFTVDAGSPIHISCKNNGEDATLTQEVSYNIDAVLFDGENYRSVNADDLYGIYKVKLAYNDDYGEPIAIGDVLHPNLDREHNATLVCYNLDNTRPFALYALGSKDGDVVTLGERIDSAEIEGDFTRTLTYSMCTDDGWKPHNLVIVLGNSGTVVQAPENKTFVYDGERHGIEANEGYSRRGDVESDEVGEYVAKLDLKEGYVWAEGDCYPREITWSIVEPEGYRVEIPEAKTLVYNGKERQGIANNDYYELSGDVTATEVGTYQVTAKLAYGHVWSDDTTEDKVIEWGIKRAPQAPLYVVADHSVSVGSTIGLSSAGGSGEGEVTFTVESATGPGSATLEGTELKGKTEGKVLVKATKAADDSYAELTSETFEINVTSALPTSGELSLSTTGPCEIGEAQASFFLSADDTTAVLEGSYVAVRAESEDITDSATEEEKQSLLDKGEKGSELGMVLRVRYTDDEDEQHDGVSKTMYKYGPTGQITGAENTAVTKIEDAGVTVKVKLPEELINKDEKVIRTFQVVQYCDDEYTVLNANLSEEQDEVSFAADRFETFALVYTDELPREAKDVTCTLDASYVHSTGKAIEPVLTLKWEDQTLVEGEDYSVSYSNNAKVGTATVTIELMGRYVGTITKTFKIAPAVTAQLNSGIAISYASGKATVKWGKVADADGYEVRVVPCGSSFTSSKALVKYVKGASTRSTVVAKLPSGKLSDKGTYKAMVRAYRLVKGKKVFCGTSYSVCVAGPKHKKYTNPKSVTLSAKTLAIKKGASKTLKPKITKASSKKSLLYASKASLQKRYFSSDPTVATVSASGTIKGKSKGTCRVYVVAINGAKTYVDVTVK